MDASSRRLPRLVRILDDTSPRGSSTLDQGDQLRLQRIQGLAAQLSERAGHGVDDVDAVAMRLMLEDYAHVLAGLRRAAAESARILEGLAASVRADRYVMDERLKQRET